MLRPPREEDVDVLLPALADPELREAGNLPEFDRAQAAAMLPQLPALAASGACCRWSQPTRGRGNCSAEPPCTTSTPSGRSARSGTGSSHARGQGVATRTARLLADHAFILGVLRVEAYVNVGNVASDQLVMSLSGSVLLVPRKRKVRSVTE